jgi:hypothetical protein
MRRTGGFLGGALILVVGATVGSMLLLDDSDGGTERTKDAARAVTPTQELPTTLPPPPPTTVAPTVPPTTSAPVPSTGDDRLSSNSRLGYAGLGPIKLGMTYADIERVGQVTVRQSVCPLMVTPSAGSGLDPISNPHGVGTITGFVAWVALPLTEPRVIDVIEVGHPAIFTISGIHVGSTADDVRRTYANVDDAAWGQYPDGRFEHVLTITNPEGRVVQFLVNPNGVVTWMTVALNKQIIEDHRKC